jgi:transposase InsO family protein
VPWELRWPDRSGKGFKKVFKAACDELGIKHIKTKPYTPKTNGKAERFVQTSPREWAYAQAYESSAQRAAALQPFLHRYNFHRPHFALNRQPPMSRIPAMSNLVKLDT